MEEAADLARTAIEPWSTGFDRERVSFELLSQTLEAEPTVTIEIDAVERSALAVTSTVDIQFSLTASVSLDYSLSVVSSWLFGVEFSYECDPQLVTGAGNLSMVIGDWVSGSWDAASDETSIVLSECGPPEVDEYRRAWLIQGMNTYLDAFTSELEANISTTCGGLVGLDVVSSETETEPE